MAFIPQLREEFKDDISIACAGAISGGSQIKASQGMLALE